MFADYSVSGRTADRQGYTAYKAILTDPDHLIETTYIDDFTRASRDELEWWFLAELSKFHRKRLIGASDGFDLCSPHSDIMITVFGLVSRLFVRGLGEKVRRGMGGTAERDGCLGKLSLGFTRYVLRDENANVVLGADGLPQYTYGIDPHTRDFRLLAFELFVGKNWSPGKIAKYFNKLKVDGSEGWTRSSIKKLLWSGTAIGVFIWNRTRRELDPQTKKWVVVENPRWMWKRRYRPDLAIVPMELWRAARRKLAAIRRADPRTGKKPSRNQQSATTLFSGTLYCSYCGEEIKLLRSAGDFKQMACLSGHNGLHGCNMSASKSTKIIEESLLKYVSDVLLSDATVDKLVELANAALKTKRSKPKSDVSALKAEISTLERKVGRMIRMVENAENDGLARKYNARAKELQSQLDERKAQLRDSEPKAPRKVPALTPEAVRKGLQKLRDVLNADIPIAAEAIRALTGPIQIRQEAIPGRKRGACWVATFCPDFARVLRQIAPEHPALPPAGQDTAPVEVRIEKIPRYEELAPKFKALRDGGASVQTIAAAHGMSWEYANQILKYADTGERPQWKAGKATGTGTKTRYIDVAEDVARLKDEKMSFPKIAKRLNISESTARRAYDHARPETVRTAAETGKTPDRGAYSHLGEGKLKQIRAMTGSGKTPKEIAAEVGCSDSTVYRLKREMIHAGELKSPRQEKKK